MTADEIFSISWKLLKLKVLLKMLLPPLPLFQSLPNSQMFRFNRYQR